MAAVEGAVEVPFIDVHNYAGGHHYVVPNEDPLLWYELLKGIYVKRAAGICSSGEVGLFAMLPLVREQLVLVDHSYKSLTTALIKFIVMRQQGASKARALFTGKDADALKAAVEQALSALPPALVEAYQKIDGSYGDKGILLPKWEYEEYYDAYYGYTRKRKKSVDGKDVNPSIVKEWQRTPAKLVRKAGNKLDKVQFVHGDFTDVAAHGPFDVFYMSNAHQHQTRDGKNPVLTEVANIVKPGGYVIACGGGGGTRQVYVGNSGTIQQDGWKLVKTVRHKPEAGDHYRIGWDHALYQIGAST